MEENRTMKGPVLAGQSRKGKLKMSNTARIIAIPDAESRPIFTPHEALAQRIREIKVLGRAAQDDAERRADFNRVMQRIAGMIFLAEEALELHGKTVSPPLDLPLGIPGGEMGRGVAP